MKYVRVGGLQREVGLRRIRISNEADEHGAKENLALLLRFRQVRAELVVHRLQQRGRSAAIGPLNVRAAGWPQGRKDIFT